MKISSVFLKHMLFGLILTALFLACFRYWLYGDLSDSMGLYTGILVVLSLLIIHPYIYNKSMQLGGFHLNPDKKVSRFLSFCFAIFLLLTSLYEYIFVLVK